jgi:hypothetical protein
VVADPVRRRANASYDVGGLVDALVPPAHYGIIAIHDIPAKIAESRFSRSREALINAASRSFAA